MKVLEILDFRKEYGIAPSYVMNLKEGESYTIEKKNQPDRVLTLSKIINSNKRVFLEKGEQFTLDTAQHWERESADFKICNESVYNLIGGIYKQAEGDYEELWIKGVNGYLSHEEYERWKKANPLGNYYEYKKAATKRYYEEIKNLEEFLGKVYTLYARVKAVWSFQSHDPKVIAKKVNISPEHAVLIIDRLGLNQTETAQNRAKTE